MAKTIKPGLDRRGVRRQLAVDDELRQVGPVPFEPPQHIGRGVRVRVRNTNPKRVTSPYMLRRFFDAAEEALRVVGTLTP
jgi:hypothetical protein